MVRCWSSWAPFLSRGRRLCLPDSSRACHFDPRLKEGGVCAQRAPLFEIKSPTIRRVCPLVAGRRLPRIKSRVPNADSSCCMDGLSTSLVANLTWKVLHSTSQQQRPAIRLVEFASGGGGPSQSPENDMTCHSHGACFPVPVSCRNFTYVVHASSSNISTTF
jgi:hypothetical protein